MKAYLQFSQESIDVYGMKNSFLTLEAEVKETETPWHGRTVSGYGSRLPTPYMVRHNGKWRRVYAACYGNAASFYIGKPGAWICTVDVWKD